MYTHISMFRFRDRATLETDRDRIRSALETFPAHIPSIQSSQVVVNCLAQPQVPGSSPLLFCDLVQIVTFASAADLAAYPQDPYHRKLVQKTDELVERVCIIDYKS